MRRRPLLRSIAAGTVPAATSGCLLGGGSTAGSVEDVSSRYVHGIHEVNVDPIEDPSGDVVPYENLPDAARREVAITWAQGNYVRDEMDHLATDDVSENWINYRDRTFDIGVNANFILPLEDDPRDDPDWTPPVELDATIGRDGLALSLANVSDGPLRIAQPHRSGNRTTFPPTFGPLIAWAGEPYVLGHDDYARNDRIVTDEGFLYFDGTRHPGEVLDEGTELELAPGDALEDTYRIPDDLSGEATVWLLLYYGGEGVEWAEPENNFGISWTITLSL